eukprot:6945-Heterococcus_DN1.PRE.1
MRCNSLQASRVYCAYLIISVDLRDASMQAKASACMCHRQQRFLHKSTLPRARCCSLVLEATEDATACTLRKHHHCARGSAVPNTKLPVAVLSCNLLLRRA